MYYFKTFISLCLLSVFSSGGYSASQYADNLEFSLLTVGVGPRLEQRYGHTILRIVDPHRGSYNLNWGMFDFRDPMFLINFYRGKLRYWVGNSNLTDTLDFYQNYQKRQVIKEKIYLTVEQKRIFWRQVRENIKPENIYFWYDFFYKNCSTIPLEYLDKALHGAIKNTMRQSPASKNFRRYVIDHLSSPVILASFLDIVLNSEVDKKITKWEEMFYPLKLREYLLDFPAYDDEGSPIPGQKLLYDTQVLGQGTFAVVLPHYQLFPYLFVVAMLIVFLILFLVWQSSVTESESLQHKAKRNLHRLFGGILLLHGILGGLLGMAMAASWIFSDHEVLSHNASLWFFWPIDVLLIPWSLRLLRMRPIKQKGLFAFFTLGHCFAAILLIFGQKLGFLIQDVSSLAYYICPPAILFYGMLWKSQVEEKT